MKIKLHKPHGFIVGYTLAKQFLAIHLGFWYLEFGSVAEYVKSI